MACHAAAVPTAVNSSNQSPRDQFGGTRQDRIRLNPDCTAEPRFSSVSDKISKVIMAPFCFQVFSVRVERMCLHFFQKKKGPGIAKKVRSSTEKMKRMFAFSRRAARETLGIAERGRSGPLWFSGRGHHVQQSCK